MPDIRYLIAAAVSLFRHADAAGMIFADFRRHALPLPQLPCHCYF